MPHLVRFAGGISVLSAVLALATASATLAPASGAPAGTRAADAKPQASQSHPTRRPVATAGHGGSAPGTATPASRAPLQVQPATSIRGPGTALSPSLPRPVTDVTAYGAVGDGHTDSGPAVRRALTAAERQGGTLYFPAGHYMLSFPNTAGAITVTAGLPLTIAGAGVGSVTLTSTNSLGPLLSIHNDHTVVQDLTLDTQSTNAGYDLYLVANYVTIQRCHILGGSHFFAIYAAGDAGGNSGNVGNRLLNDVVNDWTEAPWGDGISWSYQQNSLIENIDHTGSRLALYRDKAVTVDNYTYHPGPHHDVDDGFWISAPSDSITITDFTTYGNGGVMSANGGLYNTNIRINNEQFLGTGGQLRIDGAIGLTLTGCNLGTSNVLSFAATVPVYNIVVQQCSSLPMVHFWGSASVKVAFDDDNFPAFRQPPGGSPRTFVNYGGSSPVTVIVSGGSWENQVGGFFVGGHTTYTMNGLAGY